MLSSILLQALLLKATSLLLLLKTVYLLATLSVLPVLALQTTVLPVLSLDSFHSEKEPKVLV